MQGCRAVPTRSFLPTKTREFLFWLASEANDVDTHKLGFLEFCSASAGYRLNAKYLAPEKNPVRVRSRSDALTHVNLNAGLYAGQCQIRIHYCT